MEDDMSRREFMKKMGFATSTATLAGCSSILNNDPDHDSNEPRDNSENQTGDESSPEDPLEPEINECSSSVISVQGDSNVAEIEQVSGTEPLGEIEVKWFYEDGTHTSTRETINGQRAKVEAESDYIGALDRIEVEPQSCPGAPTGSYTPSSTSVYVPENETVQFGIEGEEDYLLTAKEVGEESKIAVNLQPALETNVREGDNLEGLQFDLNVEHVVDSEEAKEYDREPGIVITGFPEDYSVQEPEEVTLEQGEPKQIAVNGDAYVISLEDVTVPVEHPDYAEFQVNGDYSDRIADNQAPERHKDLMYSLKEVKKPEIPPEYNGENGVATFKFFQL